ncbi:MAG: hypothetical protein LBF04_04095 [Prevotellaceae bacterium]|jgi:hypothetical protein|nr:hypothetical protein [Prevotellaceae bacterium]
MAKQTKQTNTKSDVNVEVKKNTTATDVIAAIRAAEDVTGKFAGARKAAGLNVSRILIIQKQLSELGKMLKPYV